MSGTRIRPADLSRDREAILAVLERNLPGAGSPERFDWLYLENPDGPARVWIVEDVQGGAVGTSAAFPRRMHLAGAPAMALVLSDFALDSGHRTLGPALKLLRATLEPVREGAFAFSYDFPSRTMHAIYRRLGAPDLGPAARWVRPLKLSSAIRRRFGEGALSGAAGAAADALLSARDSLATRPAGVEVSELRDAFDDRFDELDARVELDRAVAGVRDSTYLNWKYGGHTMWTHRTLVAEREGELLGYAVLRAGEANSVVLVDLFTDEKAVRRALVAATNRLGRKQGAARIETEVLDEPGISRMLEGLGFVRREQGVGPVPYLSPSCPDRENLSDASSWWLNGGDRDI